MRTPVQATVDVATWNVNGARLGHAARLPPAGQQNALLEETSLLQDVSIVEFVGPQWFLKEGAGLHCSRAMPWSGMAMPALRGFVLRLSVRGGRR